MSRLVATANGNASAAATWGICDATSELDSEAGTGSLTASNLDSASFIPAAATIDAVLLKIADNNNVTPTSQLIVTLRNVTTATDVASVTIDLADLDHPFTSSDNAIGWVCFKFGTPVVANGTDSYLVRARMSNTSFVCSLFRNATTNNWSRLLRTTTTAAPAAGDRVIVTKEWTAQATGTARIVTWDITATILLGVAGSTSTSVKNFQNSPVSISKGGTITWATTASVNLKLKCIGPIVVYSGGSYIQGDIGAEIPSTSSAEVEFAMSASNDSRFAAMNGSYVRGVGMPRTSGKAVPWCLLNADVSAAATTLNVDRDTGWLSGDDIAIASTTRTTSQAENRTLGSDAGASSMVVTVGLTNAHGGANDVIAEIINLTRNVRFICTGGFSARFDFYVTANVRFTWTAFNVIQTIVSTVTTGSVILTYCAFKNASGISLSFTTANGFTVDNCVHWNLTGSTTTQFINVAAITNTDWTITNNVSVRSGDGTVSIIKCIAVGGIFTGNRTSGGASLNGLYGIEFGQAGNTNLLLGTFSDNIVHSCGQRGLFTGFVAYNKTVSNLRIWRNSQIGWFDNSIWVNCRIDSPIIFGNASSSTDSNWTLGEHYDTKVDSAVVSGDTTGSVPVGLDTMDNGSTVGKFKEITFRNCIFGSGGGTKTTHTTADVRLGNGTALHMPRLKFIDCIFSSATKFSWGTSPHLGAFISQQRTNGSLANTDTTINKVGVIAYETTTIHSELVSEKLTPVEANGSTLFSSSRFRRVISGQTKNESVWVRKDSSYNGSIQPRLVLRANPAVGIDADTVLATLSAAADTWQQLSATTPAATSDGVFEFAIQVNGTAGNAFATDWA